MLRQIITDQYTKIKIIVKSDNPLSGFQIQNYLRKQELKQQREKELTEGLKLYKY